MRDILRKARVRRVVNYRLNGRLVLKISPIREGAHVSAETAMAARSEEVLSEIAELQDVQAQPVYEILL